MGVRGLEEYMKRNGVLYRVSIGDLVQRYREAREECTGDVVAVVDGNSSMGSVYDTELCWLNGGQLVEYRERLKAWVCRWREVGVRLVFFYDGYLPQSKRAIWKTRRMESLKTVEELVDSLPDLKTTERQFNMANRNDFKIPFEGLASTTIHILKHDCGCKVVVSRAECDEEIAAYAVRNDCFAIIGRDSDFVIYDFSGYYLSSFHINIDEMTTGLYDRNRLAQSLGLRLDLLPLFASVVGNDFVERNRLRNLFNSFTTFKHWKSYWNFHEVASPVAHWISSVPMGTQWKKVFRKMLALKLGNDDMWRPIKESVHRYTLLAHTAGKDTEEESESKWEKILRRAEEMHVGGDFDLQIYQIMQSALYKCTTGFEDFRKEDLPPSMTVLSDLRRKIYGVLLHEKPDKEGHKIEELVISSRILSKEKVEVEPSFPPSDVHPGLLDLWGVNGTAEKEDARWRVVGFIMDIQPASIQLLRTFTQTMIVPVLALTYIVRKLEKAILPWEVGAAIGLAVTLPGHDAQSLKSLKPSPFDSRATRLYTLIGRAYFMVKLAIQVCGYPVDSEKIELYNFMDGKLYQKKYRVAKRLWTAQSTVESLADKLCLDKGSTSTQELQKYISDFKDAAKFIYEN